MMDHLVFSEAPSVSIATNVFVGVPIILQFEDTPLIEIIKHQKAGYTTQIPIYHPDGTYLAKVVGSRLFTTPEGEKAGLSLDHPHRMTICKFGEKVLFEITRQEAAALKTSAELYTPEGYFVKFTDTPHPELFNDAGNALEISGVTMIGNTFSGCRIGILLRADGSLALGVG